MFLDWYQSQIPLSPQLNDASADNAEANNNDNPSEARQAEGKFQFDLTLDEADNPTGEEKNR